MLHTKEDFQNCLTDIIKPLQGRFTPGNAGIKCGATAAIYAEKTALTEAFARLLWGLAPLWGGKGSAGDFDGIYLEGIINGTDPNHAEYWGSITDFDQKQVETAPIGLALLLAPDKVWEPLTKQQKDNFAQWLYQVNTVQCPDNNWNFFSVLVNLGLKNAGAPYDENRMKYALARVNSFYKGNGWYSDGATKQMDYYIAFAMHFYGLIYAKVMENEDKEQSDIFKERAMLFAKDFIYWFAEDGSSLAFGRSLTYRFAQCCFWCACIFAGIEPFPMGVMKGIIARHLEWWMSKPVFDNGGVLSIGYAYPNLIMAEEYNAPGSPYWSLKSFLILALDDEHEFFKAKALPLPQLDKVHIIPEANMVIQRVNGYVTALTAGQWVEWNTAHTAEKYSKFAYSSKYAFSVPRTYCEFAGAGTDSMLAFVKDGMCFVRRKCSEWRIESDGTVYSKWSPYRGVMVETFVTPTDTGHIRKHIIDSAEDCIAYDCAFATPDEVGSISGDGESVVIDCTPNTNLMSPKTKMKAVKYNIKEGKNYIETVVEYPI